MIIFRYFAKEVFTALSGLTSILLLVFLSNQFVRYLSLAAAGRLPGGFVLHLMMLEIPNLLGLLLPLGLFIAILLSYGRLYADSELTVMEACGFGRGPMIRITLTIAAVVAAVVAGILLFLSPYISADRDRLLTQGGLSAAIESISPGRFHEMSGGRRVFYVETLSDDRKVASDLFIAEQAVDKGTVTWNIVTAEQGRIERDKNSDAKSVILKSGNQYAGRPGQTNYQVVNFDKLQMRLPSVTGHIRKKERAMSTRALWPLNNADPKKAAELQWRLSLPLMTLVLAFIAIPLSRVRPRQGKFAKLLPAMALFIVYANFLFISRDWVANGVVPVSIGMWWLHACFIILAGFLMRRKVT